MILCLNITAIRGIKTICIITTTGKPAPKELTKILKGTPSIYWLAEIPQIKSVSPITIGPKKSKAQ